MRCYATYEAVLNLEPSLAEDSPFIEQYLTRASRAVDTLTFNRIVAVGFDHLTAFQRDIVSDVTARLAVWQAEYVQSLDSPLSGYSINGVSAQFGAGIGVKQVGGVLIPRELYAMLEQTGLCCRRV